MAKITEVKKPLIKSIMSNVSGNFSARSEIYKIVEKSLDKLAVYELSSLIVLIEASKAAEKAE